MLIASFQASLPSGAKFDASGLTQHAHAHIPGKNPQWSACKTFTVSAASELHVLCRYVTLPNIQSNASRGLLGNTTFISAGAVMPAASESTDANQCSLGELYRIGKRGGPFIATNADIPTASVYVSVHLQATFSLCLESPT